MGLGGCGGDASCASTGRIASNTPIQHANIEILEDAILSFDWAIVGVLSILEMP
jgi:hypothetical protein